MSCPRRARAGRCLLGDEPGAAPTGGEAERPADEHENAVLEADQVPEVDEEPGDPGDEAAQLQALDIRDGGGATDRRQIALVAVTERRRVGGAQAIEHDL